MAKRNKDKKSIYTTSISIEIPFLGNPRLTKKQLKQINNWFVKILMTEIPYIYVSEKSLSSDFIQYSLNKIHKVK